MKILALETSSAACSVALYLDGKIFSLHRVAPMQQTHLLLPMIDELLTRENVTLADLDAIAYGTGPGSFTGMRIASSTTQGLAFAVNLPVIPVSSLAAIAQAAHETMQNQAYLVAVDARMGQIYWACYLATDAGCVTLAGEEALCSPTNVTVVERKLYEYAGIGDGWQPYRETLCQALGFTPVVIHHAQLPTAEAVLKLSLNIFKQNTPLSATEALPSYLIKR